MAFSEILGAHIQIADRMVAHLSGRNFDITPSWSEIQAVSRTEITEWQWEVQPFSHGPQRLYLTLSALVNIDGETTPRMIQTFNKTIDVEVTWIQGTSAFLSHNWQWLWVAILAPVFGKLWKLRQQRKSNSKQTN